MSCGYRISIGQSPCRKLSAESSLAKAILLAIVCCTCAPQSSADEGSLPSAEIRRVASEVMQQQDFRAVRRRVLENLPNDETSGGDGFLADTIGSVSSAIGDFFRWVFGGLFQPRNTIPQAQPPPVQTSGSGGFSMDIGRLLLFIGLGVLVAVAIWIIASVLKSRDGRRTPNSNGLFDETGAISNLAVPPGELAVSTYESRAIQFAQEGDFRLAVRELLIGSMSWIERAGLIRFRKGLTNRDYIRAVWRQDERRLAYAETALQFERIYFGRRTATRETFDECLHHFQGSFREEEATTAAV
ncbi:DUF4129 domain-containing protein [Fuerstiella marisgermanici]|uniref:Protein-glutamine gamma-glutamyltransferase-like C-terminal domain-containing protein n=1 Tax=Fuerstiella marisgermanici TaxID=1891926 RepID=A0A1P8WDT6_9PLAN|nr:DUF4129 domain-containing protein [Fuerstiella marisgermanici]APZ92191.1 hypothetical protein Fuma_01800 [Fuerstiella marisgermanici]